MQRQPLYSRLAISVILVLQVIPLLLFPPVVYGPGSQEWWLPAMLTLMALVAVVNVFLRRGSQLWPWLLISFVQGFNIISRLMLLWSKGSTGGSTPTVDGIYIVTSIVAMLLSTFMLWYSEKPAVREGLLQA